MQKNDLIKNSIVKTILLCGGKGERLYPLTSDIPKSFAAITEYLSSFSALIQINAMPKVIGSRVVRIIRQTINRLQV